MKLLNQISGAIRKFIRDNRRISILDQKGWQLVGLALQAKDETTARRHINQSNRIYDFLRGGK